MGIPHLITFLQPYATLESIDGQHFVVDGPAFAYHIYHICLANRPYARGPFDASPSYEEIGETAIQWLGGLEKQGGKIMKVYFDGFLPPSKLDTRLGRLVALTRRLSNYHQDNAAPYIPTSNTKSFPKDIYTHYSVQSRLNSLPPTPFLVPAVIESLKGSEQYKHITQVIPGEADLYCSRHLSQYGGIVLTGDSDLLVHDLGSNGKVGFLKDLSLSEASLLELQTYFPREIVDRLALPPSYGLSSLAFEMIMDQHGAFPKLLSDAKLKKAIQAHPEMYDDFRKEYLSSVNDPPTTEDRGSFVSLLQSLDPRISEYVLQFPSISELARQKVPLGLARTAHVFLPFLLDCPLRTNAWEMSTSIRQLAYGLSNLLVSDSEQKQSVLEHKKQSDKSQGRELLLPRETEISNACRAIVELVSQIQGSLPHLSDQEFWVAVAIYQDVEWANDHSKEAISAAAQTVPRGQNAKTASWDVIHLFALIQGSYYSFRMLQQITRLVVAFLAGSCFPESVLSLHRAMATLPNLAQLQGFGHITSIMELNARVSPVACSMLGVEKPDVPAASAGAKSAKNKRKRGDVNESEARAKLSNPFGVLEVE